MERRSDKFCTTVGLADSTLSTIAVPISYTVVPAPVFDAQGRSLDSNVASHALSGLGYSIGIRLLHWLLALACELLGLPIFYMCDFGVSTLLLCISGLRRRS